VKQGDASSLLDAIEVAKGVENAKIFLPDGTYDLGETVKTIISGKNVSLIGQSAENTIIVNRPPVAMEGLDKADLLKNTGEGLYMQDISLKNDLSYGGNDGRAASLHDTGTKTICKNVFLLSHQDTYYSHKVGGLYYFEGGELHGTVDYLCGNGKAYYNEVKLVNEVRGSATITANSELYVFNNCTVENNANTYNFGRAWSDNPVCVYLNTTLLDPDRLVSTRWNLNGLNCDYSIAGEYGTKDANGNDITPE
jgi:pectin methylesterase-like acyl-CoA thioesterase